MAFFLKTVLPGAALSKANPSAYFKQQMLKPVTMVDGLRALGNSLAHFIHGPSKRTKYQEKPGAPIARAVFSVESSFLSGKFHGEHGAWHHIRRKAIFCVQCGLCEPLPPHPPLTLVRE